MTLKILLFVVGSECMDESPAECPISLLKTLTPDEVHGCIAYLRMTLPDRLFPEDSGSNTSVFQRVLDEESSALPVHPITVGRLRNALADRLFSGTQVRRDSFRASYLRAVKSFLENRNQEMQMVPAIDEAA